MSRTPGEALLYQPHEAGVRLAHQGVGSVHREDDHVYGRGVVGNTDTVRLRSVLLVVEFDAGCKYISLSHGSHLFNFT